MGRSWGRVILNEIGTRNKKENINIKKSHQWYNILIPDSNNVAFMLLVGLGLVLILSILASLNPILGVMAALMLLLLVLVIRRPVLIVYGLTFILPLVGGLARGIGVPFLRIGQTLLVMGFIFFVLTRSTPQGKSRLTAIDLAFVLYFLAEAVFPVLALLYSGEHLDLNSVDVYSGSSPFQTLLGPLQYYLLYRIVVAIISSEKQIATVLKLSFLASIIVSILGILQKLGVAPIKGFLDTYYPIINLPSLLADKNDLVVLRITSTLDSYSGLAAYLCFTMIAALACYTAQKWLKISPLLLAVTLLLDSIALILTGTFAAYIGLAVGAVVVFLLLHRLPKLVIFILVGIALTGFIFQPFVLGRLNEWLGSGNDLLPTFATRIQVWKEIFLPVIAQHLLFGAGPAPVATSVWPSEDSQWIALLLRGGLLYFFSYLLLMGIAMATCWHQMRNKSEGASQLVAIATFSILVTINIMNFAGVYFTYIGGTQILWMFLALVVASGQFEALEPSAVARRVVDDRRQEGNLPFHSSLGIATATEWSPVESDLPRGKDVVSSCGKASNYFKCKMSKLNQHHRPFARLIRLLDWHFVKDSAVVGAGSTIARVLGLLFAALLARLLKPDEFGFYQYSITLASIIGIAATASSVGITRFLAAHANNQSARNIYFSNGLFGVALLLAIMLLLSVPILWFLHALNVATIICIFCLTAFYAYLAVARGLASAWKMGLSYLLGNTALVVALFVVLGIFHMLTATAAIAIFGLTDLVPIVALELIKPMELRFRPGFISRLKLLELARFAAPIVVATSAYTVWLGIDILLVENLYPHAAGSYAVAKTLANAFLFIPSAITMVLMPRVAAQGSNRSKRYTIGAILAVLLVSLVGLVIIAVWGETLITLIFGHSYSDAYVPLLVLSIGMSIYAVYAILDCYVIGRGWPNLTAQGLFIALASTSVTGFWLTTRLGTLGSSLSFTIGAFLGTLVILLNTWRLLHRDKQLEGS